MTFVRKLIIHEYQKQPLNNIFDGTSKESRKGEFEGHCTSAKTREKIKERESEKTIGR